MMSVEMVVPMDQCLAKASSSRKNPTTPTMAVTKRMAVKTPNTACPLVFLIKVMVLFFITVNALLPPLPPPTFSTTDWVV
jgi:hypothetical protein